MADVAESDDRYAAMESLLTDAPETSGFLSRGGAATPAFRIVDAGALMEFSKRASHHGDNDLNRDNAHCVITPHSGELAKILAAAGHSDITHRDIDASPSSRLSWAQRARDAFRCTVVLKGAKTLVVPLEGDVLEVTAPTHWLATAGTGDVLAGIMGTVVAQMSESIHVGTLSLAEAAALAVVLHGYAAGLASATMSDDDPRDTLSLMLTSRVPGQPIVASDLARAIPVVIGALLAMKRARGDSAPIGFHAASSASDDGAATGFTR
jgi:NAD(P)H-hydrate repair Nnr-like enzyme with NAD(P)H-hydrate dehydratase domain